MSRFEDAPAQTEEFVMNVREKFPNLDGALIKVMYDTKKRKSGGRLVLGRIKKTNDELKAFAVDEAGQPFDYVMYLDKMVWDNISPEDRERLVFHELCHCVTDFDSNDQYKIQDHEIQTFYAEIEFTKDDPRWAERVGAIAEQLYDPDAETPQGEVVDTDAMV